MPKFQIGIFRLEKPGYGGVVKRTMAIAEHFAKRFAVTLFTPDVHAWQQRQHFFGVDLSQVNLVELRPLPQPFQHPLWQQTGWGRRVYQVVSLRHDMRQMRALPLDLFINSSSTVMVPSPARRSIYMCTSPAVMSHSIDNIEHPSLVRRLGATGKRWLKQTLSASISNHVLAQFDVITANSHFTQSWIQEQWKLPSTVVYSACELVGATQPKAKIICHAGRFTADQGLHTAHKRQDILIETFKTLPDLHQAGWQLHLAGGLFPTLPDQTYVEQLKRAAQGYPIFFHVNASLPELHHLYQSASVYWHATGYGVDPQRYPHTQEHFGMTTVEAMSAGAVPVVLNTGGQAEIVAHGGNGFVWDQLSALAAYTRRLANDPVLRATLSQQAIADSQQYSKANFLARMDTIVEQLLAGAHDHPFNPMLAK